MLSSELYNEQSKNKLMLLVLLVMVIIYTTKKKLLTTLMTFFTNIEPTLEKNIPNLQGKHFSEFITNLADKSIFLKPVTDVEIINLVKSFKSKHFCEYDNISKHIIKHVILAIVKPLTYICNISLANGIFPKPMNIAKIIPVFKNGDAKKVLVIIDQFLYSPSFQKY